MGKQEPGKEEPLPQSQAVHQGLKPPRLLISSMCWLSISPPCYGEDVGLKRLVTPTSPGPSHLTEWGPVTPLPLGPPHLRKPTICAVTRPSSLPLSPGGQKLRRLDLDSPHLPPGCNHSCPRRSPGGTWRRELTLAGPLPPHSLTSTREGKYAPAGSGLDRNSRATAAHLLGLEGKMHLLSAREGLGVGGRG